MQIAVAGGTRLVGEPLVRRFVAAGHDVAVLSRNPSRVSAGRGVAWDARTQGSWSDEVAAAGAVVNLAGENIGDGRWTAERKRRLVESRLNATHALVEAMGRAPSRTRTLVNASAVGYYGNRGDEALDEWSPKGAGFLADLVAQWEAAARAAEPVARVVILRFGVVLHPDGGALKKMLLPFKLGLGGPIGGGEQWMSWVDREDALRLIAWAVAEESARGVYNGTAPHPVKNRELTRALGRALRRPAILPVPAFALKLLFGEMAEEVLLGGQRVLPVRVEREHFAFEHPLLDVALAQLFRR
jgi:uncharacterized protein (TIGR01777 family)